MVSAKNRFDKLLTAVCFKRVNKDILKNYIAICKKHNMNPNSAINLAMDLFIEKYRVKKPFSLKLWKPTNWGSGSEKSSSEVDQVVYGGGGK